MFRTSPRLCIVLAALSFLLPSFAHAQSATSSVAPNQPNFPAALPNSTFTRQSAVIADIVPSSPGKEIAIGSQEGYLSVISSSGQLLWQQQVPPTLCANSEYRLQSNPAVGALDGNGIPYIVIGFGGIFPKGNANYCPGGVAAFDGRNGNLKWRLEIEKQSPKEALTGVAATPALADVDGNGTLEVAFGAFDRYMYLLDNGGNLLWRFHAADTIWSSPAFTKVDGDSRLDVVFSTDISANKSLGTIDGGFVYAFKTTPSTTTSRTIDFNSDPGKIENLIWRSKNYDQAIFSSPAIGDVDGNGTQDVVVSSGCYFPTANGPKNGRWIKILNLANGTETRTIDLPFCSRSSPALGDLDGDGTLDIVLATTGEAINGGDGKCHVGAWRGNGSQLWFVAPTIFGDFSDPGCDNIQAPSIADIDHNGSLEVLTTNGLAVVALNSTDGATLTDQNPTTMGIPNTGVGTNSMPVVGDIDGNGVLEVVLGGLNSVYVWTNLASAIQSTAAPNRQAGAAPWPMFRGNSERNGQVAAAPTVQISSQSIGAVIAANSGPINASITLSSNSGAALNWTASEDLPWLSLNKGKGTTPDTLVVTFDPSKVSNRSSVYEGAITISSPDGTVTLFGDTTSGSSRDLQVRLVLADKVFPVLLPYVVR